jgi:hypothetical protein
LRHRRAAIKREEKRLEKQLGNLNHQLSGVRTAAQALGGSAERELVLANIKRTSHNNGPGEALHADISEQTCARSLISPRSFLRVSPMQKRKVVQTRKATMQTNELGC